MSARELHDDPATRTRWAWLRTILSTWAVAALVVRGVLIGSGRWWPILPVVVGALLVAAVGLLRARRLRAAEPGRLPEAWGVLVVTALLAFTLIALLR